MANDRATRTVPDGVDYSPEQKALLLISIKLEDGLYSHESLEDMARYCMELASNCVPTDRGG